MQENNFEKQVQQKMDELSLSPSAEVWQKLSVTIAKDKRDRRFFIIILLLLLSLSTTLYFIFNKPSAKEYQNASAQANLPGKIKSSSNPVIENKPNGISDDTNSAENSDRNLIAVGAQQPSVSAMQNEKAVGATTATVSENTFSLSRKNRQGRKNSLEAGAVNQAEKIVYKKRQQLTVTVSENTPGDFTNENFGAIDAGTVKELADRNTKKLLLSNIELISNTALYDTAGQRTTTSIVQLNDSFVQLLTTANKKEFVIEKATELSQKKGWKFGLNFSFGASTTQAGLLGIIGPGSSDAEKAAADLSQNNPGGVTPGSPVVYYPSQVKNGAGVLMGAFAQKSISPKVSIVLGLNFKLLNSSMMTGARVDSTAFYNGNNLSSGNFYYRNGSQQNFNNHFYFIELPASIKLQLNKQKKVPVYLTTGISFARLVNSNALQFDITSGTYYRDNALLNKTQLNGALGVLFSLNAKSKNPLSIGPDIQYSFSKMANAGLYKNRHYSFIGLTVQKTIGKK